MLEWRFINDEWRGFSGRFVVATVQGGDWPQYTITLTGITYSALTVKQAQSGAEALLRSYGLTVDIQSAVNARLPRRSTGEHINKLLELVLAISAGEDPKRHLGHALLHLAGLASELGVDLDKAAHKILDLRTSGKK